MPRVHAVIVHHRGRSMLERCLESLLASTEVELEVVLVSNRCLEPLPTLAETSDRVHVVVSEESLGFSAANNLGVEWAVEHLGPCDHYYFVNNDTQSPPESLAFLVRALEARPEAAVAGPRLVILGAPGHLNSLGINVTEDAWGWDEGIGLRQLDYGALPATREVLAVTGSALLMRRTSFEAVGRWTEVYDYYFEDIDLCVKAWKAEQPVLQVPEAVVMHRISASMGVASERKLFLFWRNRLFLALIHWPGDLVRALIWRALVTEIVRRGWRDSGLQRRALAGTLRRLPSLLRCRAELRGDFAWRRFLVPPGSVPVITLPTVPALDGALETPGSGGSGATEGVAGAEGAEISSAASAGHDVADGADVSSGSIPERPGDGDEQGGPRVLRRASSWMPTRAEGRRLLVLGWGPLPFENARMNYAPGTRSWQLARGLAADGHAVCLALARIPGAYDDSPRDALEMVERDGVLIVWLDRRDFEAPGTLERLVDDFRPEALVGAAAQPAHRAVELAGDLPLWVDVFGDPMAEAQAKALVDGGGEHVVAYLRLLSPLLARGDAFSAVSDRQRWALLGQLGLAGRLGRATAGEALVDTIPVSCEGEPAESPPNDEAEPAAIEGWRPEDSDRVVLWGGGYNTWCDTEVLFEALEEVLRSSLDVHFVSTGGAIEGHDDSTYASFRQRAAASPHAERYHFAGRRPATEAASWRRRADLAVVTERPLAERLLGSSGRVQRWLEEGVPVVCADLSELGATVAREALGRTYPPGDAEALAEAIARALDDAEETRRRAELGRRWANEQLGIATTTEPLRRWARDPRRAGDAGEAPEVDATTLDLRRQLAELRTELEQTQEDRTRFEADYHTVRQELGRIHESKMWKAWMAYLAPRQWLRSLFGRS